MTKGLVSVVLPIYNVEKYLDRCIKSVVNQSYHDLEIILVDDGSPDNCPQKCDKWAKRDNRIKVIHKENAGLGMARNTGMDYATGEYIYFVDADDYIALNTIEISYLAAKRERADIVSYGYCTVGKDGKTGKCHIPKPDKYIYENEEVQNVFLPALIGPDTRNGIDMNLWMSFCGGGYSTELIRRTNWRSVSERDIISEDIFSLLRLFKDVTKVVVVPEPFYFYCENPSSLTHTFRKDRFDKINIFLDSCLNECVKLGFTKVVMERIEYAYFSNIIAALKMIVTSDEAEGQKRSAIKEIVGNSKLQNILSKMTIQKESFARKALVIAIRKKQGRLVYLMVRVKA